MHKVVPVKQQVMHTWSKDPHQPTRFHVHGVDAADCWCDPKVMEWVPGQGWVTVHTGSRS